MGPAWEVSNSCSHYGGFYIHIISSIYNFIYLFWSVLGLHCCAGFYLVAVSGGYSLAVVCVFLITVASIVVEHSLRCTGFSSCGSWALEHKLNNCGTQA